MGQSNNLEKRIVILLKKPTMSKDLLSSGGTEGREKKKGTQMEEIKI